jgi:F0F1-type ATP synthase assembly protein I
MVFDYKKNRGWIENVSFLMQIGLTMAGCIVFCFFMGFYIDRWLETRGIFVAVFTILGVIGGGVTVYRQIMDVIRKTPEEGSERDDR